MTRYTVVWEEDVQSDLAEIWLGSTQRGEITAAADIIDRELAENAAAKGEAVSEGLRSLSVPPLKVFFAVREADRLVEVARVTEVQKLR